MLWQSGFVVDFYELRGGGLRVRVSGKTGDKLVGGYLLLGSVCERGLDMALVW